MYIAILLLIIVIGLQFAFRVKNNTNDTAEQISKEIQNLGTRLEGILREEFKNSRLESNQLAQAGRTEQSQALQSSLEKFRESFDRNVQSFNDLQREKFGQLETKQNELIQQTETKLEKMRETVDEKLTKTLNERLGQSFTQVGEQLLAVQTGLGEMKSLAQDVGGLKKVLANVKNRGGVGETRLEMLLEQILAPEQYEANVKTKSGSNDLVEFAIKLPGRDNEDKTVWLPIDAKFAADVYEQLQDAYDTADNKQIESAQKAFNAAVKSMAKDISTKYIDPPNTTDFAIMFLPFEGIYAEVVRNATLLEELQIQQKIVVTGPSTLAALLNSLQMGFRTLKLQKRSSEVWTTLGAVKTEFEKFGGLLEKATKNIQTGLNQLDDVVGTRTKVINRKLKDVTALPELDSAKILPFDSEIDTQILESDDEI